QQFDQRESLSLALHVADLPRIRKERKLIPAHEGSTGGQQLPCVTRQALRVGHSGPRLGWSNRGETPALVFLARARPRRRTIITNITAPDNRQGEARGAALLSALAPRVHHSARRISRPQHSLAHSCRVKQFRRLLPSAAAADQQEYARECW